MQSGLIIEHKKRVSESKYSVGIYVNGEFIVNTIKERRHEIELEPGAYIIRVESGFRSGEIEIEIQKGKILEYHFSAKPTIYISFALSVVALVFINTEFPVLGLICFVGGLILIFAQRRDYYELKKIDEDDYWKRNNN